MKRITMPQDISGMLDGELLFRYDVNMCTILFFSIFGTILRANRALRRRSCFVLLCQAVYPHYSALGNLTKTNTTNFDLRLYFLLQTLDSNNLVHRPPIEKN